MTMLLILLALAVVFVIIAGQSGWNWKATLGAIATMAAAAWEWFTGALTGMLG